jgi:hypothetical protein
VCIIQVELFREGQPVLEFLQKAGFEVLRCFAGFGNDGILHNFGGLAGTWNAQPADVDFHAGRTPSSESDPGCRDGTHAVLRGPTGPSDTGTFRLNVMG